MRRWLVIVLLLVSGLQATWAAEPTVFTSTRYVMDMVFTANGTLWVATRGGVLRRDTSGLWSKFTKLDGLPSNEAYKLRTCSDSDSVEVSFTRVSAVWEADKWTIKPLQPWGVILPDRPAPPPPHISGTHITTRCRGEKREIAALFGEGLYEYSNGKWVKLDIHLPDKARDITALASDGNALWLGTRREGVWQYDGKLWTQHLYPNEPYNHNVQCIAAYRGKVFFSTLEDDLVVRAANQWMHISPPEISFSAPRQMVELGDSLYVRHADGVIDRLTDDKWTLDVCANLPRKETSTIASDGKRLYVGQWGGWSEFDGKSWTHHLKYPELQGMQVTAILPQPNTTWIGTQGRGLAEFDRISEKIEMHDERNGISDDWIKCIAHAGDTIYARTFVGGLFSKHGATWTQVPNIDGMEITDLSSDTAGNMLVASRSAVYQLAKDGQLSLLTSKATEAQAVCKTAEGVWIGTRTGIWLIPISLE